MSDHKFERQVRQKLGDLKLSPTPQSWEKIENEIRERKRRTAPIFWLPLLLLGLGAGGYFILKPVPITNQLAVNDKDVTAPVNTPGDSESPSASQPGTNDDAAIKVPAITQPDNKINSNTTILSKNNRTRRVGNTFYLKNAREIPFNNTAPDDSSANELSQPVQNIGAKQQAAPQEGEPAEQEKPVLKPSTADSPLTSPEAPKPARKKKNIKKWSFGVTAAGGVSAISEGKFVNFGGVQVEDVRATPNLNGTPGQFFGGNVTTAAPPPPSELQPAATYSIGFTVKRNLSERFAISGGVNYLQMNTVTKVGYRMNNRQIVNNDLGYNVVDLYYLPSEDYVNKYRNRYHFIEIPVMLHARLNRSEKLPLYWNAGASANVLLNTSALHYDGTNGVYYNDDALLNPVQGAVTTGFSVSLLNKSNRPLWIGPSARYHFSPILKKNVSTSKNFMGLTLDVRWYLK